MLKFPSKEPVPCLEGELLSISSDVTTLTKMRSMHSSRRGDFLSCDEGRNATSTMASDSRPTISADNNVTGSDHDDRWQSQFLRSSKSGTFKASRETFSHVANHDLEFRDFAGEIAAGEYGAGQVEIWDRGRHQCASWTDEEIALTFNGNRLQGPYNSIRFPRGRDV